MMENNKKPHIPVLLNEVITALNPQDGKTYVDCTFGAGGYSKAILDSCNCNLIAFDRDENVKPTAKEFSLNYKNRFTFFQECFGNIEKTLNDNNIDKVDGIVLDIGVSSMQIDNPDRGFAFRFDGPLDMRMGVGAKYSAHDVINSFSKEDIADIIYKYGEDKRSRHIANIIESQRNEAPINTTFELCSVIKKAVGEKGAKSSIQRVFQAIRIFVNDELDELEKALDASKRLLKENGNLVVVTFHSLEDRIVKNFIKENSKRHTHVSKYKKDNSDDDTEKTCFKMASKKAIIATDEELRENPRSKPAKLRFATKG